MKLPKQTLGKLRPLEKKLRHAVSIGAVEEAIETAFEIQSLIKNRRHHRLLQAKLWAFEAAVDANRLDYAKSGFSGIRQLSNKNTRIHLEATGLLAICLLRRKKFDDAKELVREVISKINNITSDHRRRQFQRRFVERIEQECVLTELIGTGNTNIDPDEMHEQAVLLLQRNSDDEILRLIGNAVPVSRHCRKTLCLADTG